MPLMVRTQPVLVLSTGTWSTGTETPDKQIRYGAPGSGGPLAMFVSVLDPDGESRKIGLSESAAAAAPGLLKQFDTVELDLEVLERRGGGSKFRVAEIHPADVGLVKPAKAA